MQAAAIVVLGARVLPDGRPSPALVRRVLAGVAAWRETPESALVLTGGSVGHPTAEAEVAAALARAEGVPASALVLERRSRTTLENLTQAAALIGPRPMIVVTDRYHLPRALLAARILGLRAEGRPVPGGPRGLGALRRAAREWAALPVTAARALAALRRG